jgi:hypothetical protein
MEARRFAEAVAAFERVLAARDSGGARFNMGLGLRALGRCREAMAAFQRVAETDADTTRRESARVNLREVGECLGSVVIRVDRAPVDVYVDGAAIRVRGERETVQVDLGERRFEARPEGRPVVVRSVVVTRDGQVEVDLRSAALVSGTAATTVTPGRREGVSGRGVQRGFGWALVGLGAGGLVLTTVELIISSGQASASAQSTPLSAEPYGAWARFNANENYDQRLSIAEICDIAQQRSGADAAQVRDLCASNGTTRFIVIGVGIASLVASAVGVTLLATLPSGQPSRAGLGVHPFWGANGAGGVITWRF